MDNKAYDVIYRCRCCGQEFKTSDSASSCFYKHITVKAIRNYKYEPREDMPIAFEVEYTDGTFAKFKFDDES